MMTKKLQRTIQSALFISGLGAMSASGAVIATIDPNGTGPAGGTISGGRATNADGTFDSGTLYISFNMESTGGFYHGFELWNGAPVGGDPNRILQIADEGNGSVQLRLLNNNATLDTVHGNGAQNHQYVIKIEFDPTGTNDSVSVFLDPTAGTTEAANTAVATASGDLVQFSNVGFASFVGSPTVTYSDVTIASTWSDVTPEPSSTALLGLGGIALILRRKKTQ